MIAETDAIRQIEFELERRARMAMPMTPSALGSCAISELNIATPSTSHPQNKTPLGPGTVPAAHGLLIMGHSRRRILVAWRDGTSNCRVAS